MRNDLTDVTLVVDRSGSMATVKDDAEGGINTFIDQQKSAPGEALLTLVQFDTEYEFIHRGIDVKKAPKYELVPRGSTALLDAVGRAINEVGERLAKMNEPDRPGTVVFVIVTDGHENSSKEFTREQVRGMIEHQQNVYKWQFVFLGADPKSFDEAVAMGMHASNVAEYAQSNTRAAYAAVGAKLGKLRAARFAGDEADMKWTTQEREELKQS
jgi:uncharacterized protein YegL